MLPKEIFSHWEEVRRGLIATIEAFDEGELDYVPFEGCRRVGEIILHIVDAEDGWLRYCITRDIDVWPDYYTLENYPHKGDIIDALTEVHARTIVYLTQLDEAGLRKKVTAPWGDEFSLMWIFWHIIEHEIHHRGELSLILGQLGHEGLAV